MPLTWIKYFCNSKNISYHKIHRRAHGQVRLHGVEVVEHVGVLRHAQLRVQPQFDAIQHADAGTQPADEDEEDADARVGAEQRRGVVLAEQVEQAALVLPLRGGQFDAAAQFQTAGLEIFYICLGKTNLLSSQIHGE